MKRYSGDKRYTLMDLKVQWLMLLPFFLCNSELMSQAPGYLGFNSIIHSDFTAFVAIRPITQDKDSNLRLNTRYGFQWEQVFSRRFSAGLSLHRITTPFWYEDEAPFGEGRLRNWDTGVFIRMYSFRKRGNIAPLGQYQQLEILYLRYSLTDVDRSFFSDGRRDLGNYSDVGLVYSFGSQRIIWNRMSLSVSVSIGTVLGLFSPNSTEEEANLKRFATERLQGHFLFNFRGGIGFLLF